MPLDARPTNTRTDFHTKSELAHFLGGLAHGLPSVCHLLAHVFAFIFDLILLRLSCQIYTR